MTVNISNLDLSGRVTFDVRVGGGGYSDIFRGKMSGERETEVAIKALRVHGENGTPASKERLNKHFYREVLLWRGLRHSNIVPLLGYIMRPDEPPHLVSPWYGNGNVIQYLKTCPHPNRQLLARGVISGLVYLHSIPVAHGDLKCENVLVDAHGNASLCDFGMSQFIEEASRITGFTTTNAHLGGTDRFMCPELLDDRPRSTATDIWALGCLIIQILSDEIPYHHIVIRQAVLFAISRGEPPLASRPDAVDPRAWSYVVKCWNMNPLDRPVASELELCFGSTAQNIQDSHGELTTGSYAHIKKLTRLAETRYKNSNWTNIELSPDSKYAVISGGGDINIVRMGSKEIEAPTVLVPSWTGGSSKVVWSKDQRHVLEAMHGCSRIWYTMAGDYPKIIFVYERQGQVALLNDDNLFALLEPSTSEISIRELSDPGNVVFTNTVQDLNGTTILGYAFTPDDDYIVILTELSLQVNNMNTGVLESRADISSLQASHVTHVTQRWPDIPIQPVYVSRDGCFILISTLEKEPEVWMLSRSPSYWGTTELSHLHRYKSSYWAITEQSHLHRYQSPTDSLSSDLSIQFGGIDDQLVLAASRGYVNIWDRDTASLIHSLCAEDGVDYGYMSFRWNSNDPDDIMLALLQGTRFRRGKNYQSLQVWGVSQSQLQPDHPTYDQDLQNIPRNLTKPIIEGKVETANTRSFKGFMARLRRTLRAMIPL